MSLESSFGGPKSWVGWGEVLGNHHGRVNSGSEGDGDSHDAHLQVGLGEGSTKEQ